MDWPKARVVLLIAFTLVNTILAYALWGPSTVFSHPGEAPYQQQVDQVRATLLDRGLTLPTSVTVPRTPEPMRFLHVEHRLLNPDKSLPTRLDPVSQAVIHQVGSTGTAAREMKLENRNQVQQVAEEYLRQHGLLPKEAELVGLTNKADSNTVVLEYVPLYDGYPIYSGYVKVELSARGIELVTHSWVEPTAYTSAPAKAVRPAPEALLRLAGRLEPGQKRRVITDIHLGYYAGRSLTATTADMINSWDTVPVWRIGLDNGEAFYINALNGEWES